MATEPDPLMQAFLEEAKELLADFEVALLELETRPDDTSLLQRIFRSTHTLKGNAGMLGFDRMAHFAHSLEDLLDRLRKGTMPATPSAVDALLQSGDVMRAFVTGAGEPGSGPDAESEARALSAIRRLLEGDVESDRERDAEAAPQRLFDIHYRPAPDAFRRGLDPLHVIDQLAERGEIVESTATTAALPALADLDPERCHLEWSIVLRSRCSPADVAAHFEPTGSAEVTERAPVAAKPAAADREPTVRRATKAAMSLDTQSLRIPVERVDRLLDLVGELTISQAIVAQALDGAGPEATARLREAVARMNRLSRELHERMMSVRMIPIRMLFGHYPRLVRDLSASLGKEVRLVTSGEDTELDKTVVEKVGDSLTHLLRNAIDHGIEPPADRRAAGKPDAGTIRLDAWQQGGSIHVALEDDGRGLDRERILAKAVNSGLVEDGASLEDPEVFALIFRAGFSTADRVTELSGRGVGMDVVKQNVEALGGSISIESTRGKGTRFRLQLPLTLAILDGQVLRVGDQVFVLPLAVITESVKPDPDSVRSIGEGDLVLVRRGLTLPLVRLDEVLGIEPSGSDATEGLAVIVEHDGRSTALLVDELLGQQQIVIKAIETHYRKVEGVGGATILGDGRVALILDVAGLVALARHGRLQRV